jgi:hypothetical protein
VLVIPTTVGSITRREEVQASVGKKARSYLKNNRSKVVWRQVVECELEVANSNPTTTQKMKRIKRNICRNNTRGPEIKSNIFRNRKLDTVFNLIYYYKQEKAM